MAIKQDWEMMRRNSTREARKHAIMSVFTRFHQNQDAMFTAGQLAKKIGLLTDDYVRAMCNELVTEGRLRRVDVDHRKLSDGVTIRKQLFGLPISDLETVDDLRYRQGKLL